MEVWTNRSRVAGGGCGVVIGGEGQMEVWTS